MSAAPATRPPVVLVHGLFLGAWSMRALARFLARRGFRPHCFDYDTVASDPDANARALARCLRRRAAPRVHVVAHSMGGLLVRHALALDPSLPIARCVMMGTPNRGSVVAHRLAGWPVVGGLIANGIAHGLDGSAPPWPRGASCALLAGTRARGAGMFVAPLVPPHDGTVTAAETELDGIAAPREVHESHTGMLWAKPVAATIARYLREGFL